MSVYPLICPQETFHYLSKYLGFMKIRPQNYVVRGGICCCLRAKLLQASDDTYKFLLEARLYEFGFKFLLEGLKGIQTLCSNAD